MTKEEQTISDSAAMEIVIQAASDWSKLLESESKTAAKRAETISEKRQEIDQAIEQLTKEA